MALSIDVVFSPTEPLSERDAWLVVDILRATTVITTFFECGGRRLMPVDSVERAWTLKKQVADRWLMGERDALLIDGFDWGNSPLGLKEAGLASKPAAVMTTSNGTHALLVAHRHAVPVYAACARNAEAAVQAACEQGSRIGILSAGRHRRAALDDTACCGALVERALAIDATAELSDGARMALMVWQRYRGDLRQALSESEHGRYLQNNLGLNDDLAFCAELDVSRYVARLSDGAEGPEFLENDVWVGSD